MNSHTAEQVRPSTVAEDGPDVVAEQRRQRLARLLEQRSDGVKYRPVSFAQHRFWFLSQFQPDEPLFHFPLVARMRGALDPVALRAGVTEIVRRHEDLRTNFQAIDGQPVQRIVPPRPVPVPLIDISRLTPAQRARAAKHVLAAEQWRFFDLTRDLLFRIVLLQEAPDVHLLVLTVHHIVTDGWSMSVFVRELKALYTAYRAGQPSPLPPLPIQYADFAVWQRRHLQGAVLEEHLRYWRDELTGIVPLDLPTDYQRPTMASHRGTAMPFTIPPDLTAAIAAFSQREGVTTVMTMLAAWQLLVSRYSGQDDICVGVPIANRNRTEIEGLIGFFVNTLVLRTRIPRQATVRELVHLVKDKMIAASQHQDLPIERVAEELGLDREMSRSPLFQVMFVGQNTPRETLMLGDARAEWLIGDRPVADFEMTLGVYGTNERGQACLVEYVTDLYSSERVARLIGHLQVMLASMVANPDQQLGDVPWLTPAEQESIVEEWPREGTLPAGIDTVPLIKRFEQHAARRSAAVAVTDGAMHVSYAALNARANQWARALRAAGVGPESRVGICLERGIDPVVVSLAVWKTGAAYVPLDPAHPPARLAQLLHDSGAGWFVTSDEMAARVGPGPWREMTIEARPWADRSTRNLSVTIRPDQLAQVIYTSGSMGQPKGVAVVHGGLSAIIAACAIRLGDGAGPAMRMLQFASWGFDGASWEFGMTLPHGGCLVVGRTEQMLPGGGLEALLTEQQVNVAALPPSVLRTIDGDIPGLTTLVAGAEACPADVAARWGQGRFMLHGYGQTETTIAAVVWGPVNADEAHVLGRPLPGVSLYALSDDLQPVPVGVPGELYVGGAGMSRGYIGQPRLTGERFVPHPFSTTPGARLYRTGDRVRWRADGHLEFIGRTDRQVKLRGYRIEMREVELALERQPGVRQAVVLTRGDGTPDRHLVAYVVGTADAELDGVAMRTHLRDVVPTYMVPRAIVVLPAWPLTMHAKIDMRALPEPIYEASILEEPRTPTERQLAEIWKDVLKREFISRSDDFFMLGGHSLLATQVMSRVRDAFDFELPLRTLFESPTLEILAARIDASARATDAGAQPSERIVASDASQLPQLAWQDPDPRVKCAPVSFAQHRFWFLSQFQPDEPLYHFPMQARLRGPLDPAAMRAGLTEIVRRHEALRTTFPVVDGQPLQRIAPPTPVPLPIVDITRLTPAQRQRAAARVLREEQERFFDLSRDRLFRAALLREEPDVHLLVLTMHHIITDGWSMAVFIRELRALYAAARAGQPSPLPALPIQYADFAVWQRRHLQGPVLEEHLRYWREALSGIVPLDLPTDLPRPLVASHRGTVMPFMLPPALTDALVAFSQREGVTLVMTMLAAWQLLVSRYAGQDDICVGVPIANRNRAEIEGLIGFFVNTLVLRTRIRPQSTVRELVRGVKESMIAASHYQDLPIERVAEELGLDREMSRSPMFQVMFVGQNAPRESLTLDDVRVEWHSTDRPVADFEMTLGVYGQSERGLTCLIEYVTDLYSAARIERLIGHLQVMLASMVARPDQRVADVSWLTPSEEGALLEYWPREGALAADVETLPLIRRFEHHAALRPHAIAVADGAAQVSYGALNARANQWARALRAAGVVPESRVGLCLERGIDPVVVSLAIWKAGAAYVPLDPAHPPARIAQLLGDSGAQWLVTSDAIAARVGPGPWRAMTIESQPWTDQAGRNLSIALRPDHLAQVIYTSGSTGQPKGVAVVHGGLSGVIAACAIRLGAGVSPDMRLLQFASWGFDAATWEFGMAIAHGGCLILGRTEEMLPGGGLEALLIQHGVTIAALPPSVLGVLDPTHVRALSTLVAAIDASPADVIARWAEGRRLVNGYGQTETSIGAVISMPDERLQVSVLGRPLAGVDVYVLNDDGQPVPVGVPGELFVGGVGVSRGYVGQPALTAERFVPHPFSTTPGARVYRTGDRVRWRADGQLTFIGRTDRQVKLRGYRIELREIERALERLPGVRQALVITRDDDTPDRHLAAYVVGVDGATLDGAQLRTSLRDVVPTFMVPRAVVVLKAWPLTVHGKIDTRALPAPAEETAVADEPWTRPATPLDELVAQTWMDALKVDAVRRSDSFFALGGHSLLAIQVVSRLRDALGIELPLRTLFETDNLGAFVMRVSAALKGDTPSAPPLVARHARVAPLSFSQQRLWFLHALEPDSAAYQLSIAFELTGDLDVAALSWALGRVVDRHAVLRTTLPLDGDQPVQRVHDGARRPLPVVDLTSSAADATRKRLVQQVLTRQARAPFDLQRDVPIRFAVLRIEPRRHVLGVTMHHVATDGRSIDIFLQELAAYYEARVTGTPLTLPDLPVQFADYAAWQRAWLTGEVLDQHTAHWRERLNGAPCLEIPTDLPRPSRPSRRAATVTTALSEELTTELQALSRRSSATLFMTLLAAFHVLVARRAGQEDVAVGTDVVNRTRSEIEPMIGFFVNQLVLRAHVAHGDGFGDVLARVRASTIDAYEHAELPFEKLVEDLAPPRDLARAPLFQIKFLLQTGEDVAPALHGLELREIGAANPSARLDLTLVARVAGSRIHASLVYATDLFRPDTAERILSQWQAVLQGAVLDAQADVWRLPLMNAQERDAMLARAHAGEPVEAPSASVWTSIPELFARCRQATPDAIAVADDDRQFTYQALDERANQLAHHLIDAGVGSEVRVAICMDGGVGVALATLGVLKSGAAYVGLDPHLPVERLAYMLEDSGAVVILTEPHLRDRLPSVWATIVCPDDAWFMERTEPTTPPSVWTRPESLAYVLYTSGSSGRPKAVAVEHGQISAYVEGVTRRIGLPAGASYAHVSSLAADLGNTSLYGSLCAGGTLHLISAERARDAEALADYFTRHRIDVVKIVPSHLHALMAVASTPASLLPERCLVLGGEASRGEWIASLRTLKPQLAIWNHYGPTECAVGVAAGAVPADLRQGNVPIGTAFGRNRLYVVDDDLELLPPGIPGELLVGGAQVARGYPHAVALTAERFIPDPFGASGARLYRTGDRVRATADGAIEFLSRIDDQVKVQGHRIEPGEIEAALRAIRDVQACAVVTDDDPEARRLIAFVVSAPDRVVLPDSIRQALRDTLPEWMIPSAIEIVDEIPRLPNGKVDRRTLLQRRASAPAAAAAADPRDNVEMLLHEMWRDILGVDAGVADDFFAVGGSSIAAVSLTARLRAIYGDRVKVQTIFEHPTLDRLAAYLRRGSDATVPSTVVALRAKGDRPPLFCVPGSDGMAHSYLRLVRHLGEGQPVFAFQYRGLNADEQPIDSVAGLAREFVRDLRRIQPDGPYHLAGWSMGGVVAYEMARQLTAAGAEVALVAVLDSLFGPFADDEADGRVRAELLRNVHHSLGLFDAETIDALIADPTPALALDFGPASQAYVERAQQNGRIPADWSWDLCQRWLRLMFTNVLASLRYAPQSYSGPVLLVNLTNERHTGARTVDERRGLDGLATHLTIHRLIGEHAELVDPPLVRDVAALIEPHLTRVDRQPAVQAAGRGGAR